MLAGNAELVEGAVSKMSSIGKRDENADIDLRSRIHAERLREAGDCVFNDLLGMRSLLRDCSVGETIAKVTSDEMLKRGQIPSQDGQAIHGSILLSIRREAMGSTRSLAIPR